MARGSDLLDDKTVKAKTKPGHYRDGVHAGTGLFAHMGDARGAATACRQGAARRLACTGRTARFPRCCRAAARRRGDHAPSLHRCGY
jgi:hypothetical protein